MNGMKVKALRCYLGESMESFANRIGVSASTISAIENKQREISDIVRAKLIRLESDMPDDFIIFYERFQEST